MGLRDLIWTEKLKKNLRLKEGLRLDLYKCPAGKISIGYGHNLEDNGIRQFIAEVLLNDDVSTTIEELKITFDNFETFSDNRKMALADMLYNLGRPRFLSFKKMIKAIKKEDWEAAKKELIDSKYYRSQITHGRALSISRLF